MNCLYITGEESIQQIKLRASRLGLNNQSTTLLAAVNIEDIISTLESNKLNIDLIIIDSIQTMLTPILSSPPGTVSQIRACATGLVTYAKRKITLSC